MKGGEERDERKDARPEAFPRRPPSGAGHYPAGAAGHIRRVCEEPAAAAQRTGRPADQNRPVGGQQYHGTFRLVLLRPGVYHQPHGVFGGGGALSQRRQGGQPALPPAGEPPAQDGHGGVHAGAARGEGGGVHRRQNGLHPSGRPGPDRPGGDIPLGGWRFAALRGPDPGEGGGGLRRAHGRGGLLRHRGAADRRRGERPHPGAGRGGALLFPPHPGGHPGGRRGQPGPRRPSQPLSHAVHPAGGGGGDQLFQRGEPVRGGALYRPAGRPARPRQRKRMLHRGGVPELR